MQRAGSKRRYGCEASTARSRARAGVARRRAARAARRAACRRSRRRDSPASTCSASRSRRSAASAGVAVRTRMPAASARVAGGVRARLALHLDQADAAAALRREARLVAERRDRDAGAPRGGEDRLARLGRDAPPVDPGASLTRPAPKTRSRKCVASSRIGPGTSWPKAHRLACSITSNRRSSASRGARAGRAAPAARARAREPSRHGAQRPHDSSRMKREPVEQQAAQVRALRQRDQTAVAEPQAARGHRVVADGHVAVARQHDAAHRSAEQHGVERAALRAAGPRARSRAASGVPNSTSTMPGRAKPALRHSADRAGAAARAEARVPRAAARDDRRHARQRLDVVHHGRPAVEPALGRIGRPQPHLAAPALDRVEQRGLLAAHVAAVTRHHAQLAGEVAAEDARTREPGRARLARWRRARAAARAGTRSGCRRCPREAPTA